MSTLGRQSQKLSGLIPTILLGLHGELCLHPSLLLLVANGSELSQLLQVLLFALVETGAGAVEVV